MACNWGILGAGRIAHKFADAVARVPGNAVIAAASMTAGKAEAFAAAYQGIQPYQDYAALLENPRIDAVYIANLHNMHEKTVIQALRAGKATLCEKPMGVNAAQVRRMAECAKSADVFLMEAMWTRFLPTTKAVRKLLAEGGIGEVRAARSAFTNLVPFNPDSRLYSLEMTGGALLDLGVYQLAYLLTMFDQQAELLHSVATLSPSGVDDLFIADLRFPGDRLASLLCGMRADVPGEMCFYGTEGRVSVANFWEADHFIVHRNGKERRADFPFENGFVYEVEAVSSALAQNLTECPEWPLVKSIAVAEMMDALRAQWGLVYPNE